MLATEGNFETRFAKSLPYIFNRLGRAAKRVSDLLIGPTMSFFIRFKQDLCTLDLARRTVESVDHFLNDLTLTRRESHNMLLVHWFPPWGSHILLA